MIGARCTKTRFSIISAHCLLLLWCLNAVTGSNVM
jgi:hypothetical protein